MCAPELWIVFSLRNLIQLLFVNCQLSQPLENNRSYRSDPDTVPHELAIKIT